jgi:uncharacterized protein YjiS (DUF1127 family)
MNLLEAYEAQLKRVQELTKLVELLKKQLDDAQLENVALRAENLTLTS